MPVIKIEDCFPRTYYGCKIAAWLARRQAQAAERPTGRVNLQKKKEALLPSLTGKRRDFGCKWEIKGNLY